MSQNKHESGVTIAIYGTKTDIILPRPLVDEGISAGFPSPAADFDEMAIDLNKHLIKHPAATFYGRVKGESMRDAGINDGDLLVIDKSIEPTNGKIAVCYIDGDFTLKRIKIDTDGLWLMPENENYKPIHITENNDLRIWGVVSYVIKAL